jgi:hypothetical protein
VYQNGFKLQNSGKDCKQLLYKVRIDFIIKRDGFMNASESMICLISNVITSMKINQSKKTSIPQTIKLLETKTQL